MNIRISISSVLLVMLLLEGCQSADVVLDPTPTIAATPTIGFQSSYVPTLEGGGRQYTVPEWLNNPDNNVFLLNDFGTISFWDPVTGSRADILLSDLEANSARWLDNQHVGFFKGSLCDGKGVLVLDLSTGLLLPNEQLGFPLDEYCTTHHAYQGFFDYSDTYHLTIVDYLGDGKREEMQIKQAGWYNLEAKISPDGKEIAVVQSSGNPESGNFNWHGEKISFFNRKTRRKEAELTIGNIRSFYFSRDSRSIIFLNENTPCVFHIETGAASCGVVIPNNYRDPYLMGVMKDGNRIVFAASIMDHANQLCIENQTQQSKSCNTINIEAGLCLFDIFNGDVTCPTRGLTGLSSETRIIQNDSQSWPITDVKSVTEYSFSPDEQFLFFTYEFGSPDQHYFGGWRDGAVISMDGVYQHQFKMVFGGAWRPPPAGE